MDFLDRRQRHIRVPHPEDVAEGGHFLENLNPESLRTVVGKLEPALATAAPGDGFQFERHGYFCVDQRDSSPDRPVFNRSVALRDSWARIEQKMAVEKGQEPRGRAGSSR